RDFHVTGVQTCALPIYDYREMISEIISRMDRGKIFYFDDQNVVDSCEGRPVRLEERSAEGLFLVLDSGKAIRADRLITVFGKPRSEERRVGKECRCRGV